MQECERLLPLAQAKGLTLIAESPESAVRLRTDRIKLIRILSNLVGNAIKFTQTGRVTVAAMLAGNGSPLIRVTDTGIGMASEDLVRIFDEYGQLGNPERDSNKGWGLGLPICTRLAAAMGGKIEVESEPGRGTTFIVQLPASCVMK
jgi:signal transduction histidine kinase